MADDEAKADRYWKARETMWPRRPASAPAQAHKRNPRDPVRKAPKRCMHCSSKDHMFDVCPLTHLARGTAKAITKSNQEAIKHGHGPDYSDDRWPM